MSPERTSRVVTGPRRGPTVSKFPGTIAGQTGLVSAAELGAAAPTSHPRVAPHTLLRAKADERPVPELLPVPPIAHGRDPHGADLARPICTPARPPLPSDRGPRTRDCIGLAMESGTVVKPTSPRCPPPTSPAAFCPPTGRRRPPRGRSVLAELGPRDQWPVQLTLEQAAAYLQVSTTYLEESGIPVVRLPTTGMSNRALRRWRRKDLDKYIEEHLCRDPRMM